MVQHETQDKQDGSQAELPLDAETIEKMRNSRIPYLEAREAVELEQKEIKVVREQIGAEIREKCQPEIDDYIDCCVGRIFTHLACRKQALIMRKCLMRIETPEFVAKRTAELLAEREASASSVVNNAEKGATRQRRAQYNRAILPEVDPQDGKNSKSSSQKRATADRDPMADIE